jgi:ubiquinone/menaquinone biosynthesis C-methylase UbiE
MTEPAQPAAVNHPLFARVYARVLARNEPAEMREQRIELLAGAHGRTLEIGAGSGANFPHYPSTVTEVVAVEPESYLRKEATAAAAKAPVPITVLDGVADAIPAPDASFDTAIVCIMLCSVPDQATALAELRRVLKPGGELRFFEHVRSAAPRTAALQRFVDRTFWPRAFGGCHTHRDTVAEIERAGFEIEAQRRQRTLALSVAPPVATQVFGIARRPA